MKALTEKFCQQNKLFRKVFFQYLIDQLHLCLVLCKGWKRKIYQILQSDLNIVKAKFQQKHAQLFLVQQLAHFLPRQQMIMYKTLDGKKTSIDFIMKLYQKQSYQFEENAKYTISYSYQLNSQYKKMMIQSRKKAKKYFWKLEFDYIGDQFTQKTVWMYKDYKNQKCCQSDNQNLLSQPSLTQNIIPYVMDSQPLRKKQIIQIKIPYCVRNTLLNFQSFEFYKIQQQSAKLSTIERFFSKKQVKSCPIENLYQWKSYDYFKNPISFEIDDAINCYKNQLRLEQISINSLGDHYKIQFICKQPLKQSLFMGHMIQILPKMQNKGFFETLNFTKTCRQNIITPIIQLKRKGIYQQKQKKIIFRVQDRLIVYLCETKDE